MLLGIFNYGYSQTQTPAPTQVPGTFYLSISVEGEGYIVAEPGGQVYGGISPQRFYYEPDTLVTLRVINPTPNPCGQECPQWFYTGIKGDTVSPDGTIVIDNNKSIIVVFSKLMQPPEYEVPRFEPVTTVHTLFNLDFIDVGIPTDPILFPSIIIGDFTFTNEIHANTETEKLASYGFTITFDDEVVIVNTEEGEGGVSPGSDGFLTSVDTGTPGVLIVSGYDAEGTGPGTDLHVLTVHWLAQTYKGRSDLRLIAHTMGAVNGNVIGTPARPSVFYGSIIIRTKNCVIGDVNADGYIDIVDALLIAQYFVGLNPVGYFSDCGDVNCDGDIDIIDALLIAQYYVELIENFC